MGLIRIDPSDPCHPWFLASLPARSPQGRGKTGGARQRPAARGKSACRRRAAALWRFPMQCCPLAAWLPLTRRLALAIPAVALATLAAWAWSGSAPPDPKPPAEPPPAPFSASTQPAKNPEQLLLLADGHQVV